MKVFILLLLALSSNLYGIENYPRLEDCTNYHDYEDNKEFAGRLMAIISAQLVNIGIDYTRENNIAQAMIISDCCRKILNDFKAWLASLDDCTEREQVLLKIFGSKEEYARFMKSILTIKREAFDEQVTEFYQMKISLQVKCIILYTIEKIYEIFTKANLVTDKFTDQLNAIYDSCLKF